MGCFFLGCFGFSSKRKRPKSVSKHLSGHQKLGSYGPLDSVSAKLDLIGDPLNSASELRKKSKEPLNYRIRKKVSFNLNVQTYEPIPAEESADFFWASDEEEKNQEAKKGSAKEDQSCAIPDGDSTTTKLASYPSNYRYRSCIDSYDEEDEIAYEESDMDDDSDSEECFEEDGDGSDVQIDELRISQGEFSEQFQSSSLISKSGDSLTKLDVEASRNPKPLGESDEKGLNFLGINRNTRDRSQYVHSVLNPVENLDQWKAVKARGAPATKHQRKENVALDQQEERSFAPTKSVIQSRPLMTEIAVDASLSNWLGSSDCYDPQTTSTNKSTTTIIETVPSKNSISNGAYSWRKREDVPILDITNLEA